MKLPAILFLFFSLAQSQDTVRLVTYNLLAYDGAERDEYFRTVIQSIQPDILVVQELDTSIVIPGFLIGVLNAGSITDYAAGVFVNGPDSDNMLFYRSSKFSFVANQPIKTALRNLNDFSLIHTETGLSLRVISVHLNAGEPDSSSRSAEVDSLRKYTDALPIGTDFLVVGDFNIYGSEEYSYRKLVAVKPGVEGHAVDPLSMTGIWNSFEYAGFHTQSTRTRAFGGGATGGLDDRFDMILVSQSVAGSGGVSLVPGSVRPFGNDGQHYNDSINRLPNLAVSESIANALHQASDHLPVVCELVFEHPVSVRTVQEEKPALFQMYQSYPNPFFPRMGSGTMTIRFILKRSESPLITIHNILGEEVRILRNTVVHDGNHTVTWNGRLADGRLVPAGVYFVRIQSDAVQEVRKIIIAR
ncbi:MAG: endonuclease/exonuclease/phosphatase family protein [Bacteroidota bacterium]